MAFLAHIPSLLRNKFFLATAAFTVWMLFFDKDDLFARRERQRELRALQESKEYYTEQIARERKALEELQSNPAAIEKYAREKYLMKRENEDLFLIQPSEN
ncbi:MAG TPA: septum formation initiator family protein [Chitinophagaceae bacterium]|jgi:cell division protein FtsB|nr:septum formation initiator family protein [Chitinophagaceae bacterium]